MPTITTVDAAWTPSPSTFDDAEARRFDTAMFLGDGSNNGVRGGVVRHGDNSLAVAVNGSDQVTVQAGAFVIPAATGLGVYRGALQSTTAAVALATRNATNPRIDLIAIQATSTGAVVKTIDGTPSSSPAVPSLPAQHIELARVTVPASGGGAVTVDSSWRQYATSIGGRLIAETPARLPGSGNLIGQRAIVLSTGGEHFWNGTSWTPAGATQVSTAADYTVTNVVTAIPDLSVVTSGPGTGATFMAHVTLDLSILNVDNQVGWNLYVDNAPYGAATIVVSGSVSRMPSTRTFVVTGLSAGPHTFTVRINRTGTAGGSIVRSTSTLAVDVRG